MSPVVLQLIVQLVEAAISEAPSLIADIEKLFAAAKGQPAPDASWQPIAPQVDQQMAPLESELQQPIPAKK